MLLRRLGNKSKLAHKIQEYFPPHSIYVEFFFGAGGMFFNKPKVKHNFLNDLDNDVYNLFMMLREAPEELYEKIRQTPKHESIFKHWKATEENDPIWKAVRFLYLSNYSMYGTGDVICNVASNTKKIILKSIQDSMGIIQDVNFMNCDFRDVMGKIAMRGTVNLDTVFIFADPPYAGAETKNFKRFTEKDSIDCLDVLRDTGLKYAMTEYNSEFILDQAAQRSLHVVEISNRRTMKNRNTEVLIMNYEPEGRLF